MDWELQDPQDSANNVTLKVIGTEFKYSIRRETGLYNPVGRNRQVLIRDRIKGAIIDVVIEFLGQAEFDAFMNLVELEKVMYLQSTYGDQWWVDIDGNIEVRVVNTEDLLRFVSLTFVEVNSPY